MKRRLMETLGIQKSVIDMKIWRMQSNVHATLFTA